MVDPQSAGDVPENADAAEPEIVPAAGSEETEQEPAAELTEDDFLPESPEEFSGSRRKPGPGLLEALGWMIGLVMLQAVGGMVGMMLAIGWKAAKLGPAELLQRMQKHAFIQQFMQDKEVMVALFCGIQGMFLGAAIVAAYLRLGTHRRRTLPLGPVPVPHAVVLGLLILPLVYVGDFLYRVGLKVWEWILSFLPALERLGETSSMDQIAEIVPVTPLLLLMVLIAVVPAVAEELMFRGVLGRGLVARWGLPRGIAITSLLFAAVHVHPAHAFALLPLAVCIHLSYLSTQSFWAPMGMHFVNNAWGVLVLKLIDPDQVAQAQQMHAEQLSPMDYAVYAAAALFVVTLTAMLWQMRVHYLLPGGGTWNPGYAAAEAPPAHLAATRQYAFPDRRLLAAAALCGLLLMTAFIANALLEAEALAQ